VTTAVSTADSRPRVVIANRADGGYFYWVGKLYAFAAIVIFTLLVLTGVIVYSHFSLNAPPVPNLERYASITPGVTRMYAADGTLLGEFYTEKRYLVPIAKIPAVVREAFIAAEDTFSEEERDAAWASQTEPELRKRWKAIRGGKLQSVECKKTQCKLVVTGPQQDLAMAIADLEGPRGLHGYAENVLLSNPTVAADGTVMLRIYVKFER
jgi:hypothetical protein